MSTASNTVAAIFGIAVIGAVGMAATAQTGVNPLMTDYDGAERIVKDQYPHLQDVKATGYGWFACGVGESGDWWRTDFSATNREGKEITGTVCDNMLKGATIRFD